MEEINKNNQQEPDIEEVVDTDKPSIAFITEGALEENVMELNEEQEINQQATETEKNDAIVPSEEAPEEKVALRNIVSKLDRLEKHFEGKLKYDQHKEQTIDKLHHELQQYKDDLIGKLLKPVFMDIIEVIDDLHKILRSLAQKGALDNPEKLLKVLKEIPEDLEDKLYRHGVEVMDLESNVFNPTYQKILKVVLTPEANLDKTINEKLKKGYQLEGKLIRHEMITVFKYQEEEQQAEKEATTKD